MLFLSMLMLVGLAILAGGQVWALTGSLALAAGCGAVVALGLGGCYRRFFRRRDRAHFVGEVRAHIDEGEFVVRVPRGRSLHISPELRDHPARIAAALRAALRERKGADGDGRRK